MVYVVLCFLVGCQYQCNWSPGTTHPGYDLLRVEWDVKRYTLTHSLTHFHPWALSGLQATVLMKLLNSKYCCHEELAHRIVYEQWIITRYWCCFWFSSSICFMCLLVFIRTLARSCLVSFVK